MFKKLILCTAIIIMAAACTHKKPDSSSSIDIGNNGANTYQQDGQRNFDRDFSSSNELEAFTPLNDGSGRTASDRVFFDLDSSNINYDGQETLNRQARYLRNNPTNILIEGHCDERGTREYNIALGDRRANAVRRYLISAGVDANSISTISYGKERPEVVGYGESSHSENRRAVTILK